MQSRRLGLSTERRPEQNCGRHENPSPLSQSPSARLPMALLLACETKLKNAGVNSAAIRGRPLGSTGRGTSGGQHSPWTTVCGGGRCSRTHLTTAGCVAAGRQSQQITCAPSKALPPPETLAMQTESHVLATFSVSFRVCFSESQFLRLVTALDGSRPAPVLFLKLTCLSLAHELEISHQRKGHGAR